MKKLLAPSLIALLLLSLVAAPVSSGCSPRMASFLAGAVIATAAIAVAVDHAERAAQPCCQRYVYYDGREVWDCCGRWEYYDEDMGAWYYYEEEPPALQEYHQHYYYTDEGDEYYYYEE